MVDGWQTPAYNPARGRNELAFRSAESRSEQMSLAESFIAVPPPLYITEEGVVRVSGTRVTLDTVIAAHEEGETPEQIVESYSALNLADVYAVISYYLRHRSEVEAHLEERRRHAEEVRRQNEARFPPDGVRERLLARRKVAESPDAGVPGR
jgi:uncharacterized protein (DUF433 family)